VAISFSCGCGGENRPQTIRSDALQLKLGLRFRLCACVTLRRRDSRRCALARIFRSHWRDKKPSTQFLCSGVDSVSCNARWPAYSLPRGVVWLLLLRREVRQMVWVWLKLTQGYPFNAFFPSTGKSALKLQRCLKQREIEATSPVSNWGSRELTPRLAFAPPQVVQAQIAKKQGSRLFR
jgi:hypothetical protein